MSSLDVKDKIEDCYSGYGREDFVLTVDDIADLINGKILSGDVSAGEYGVTIQLSENAKFILNSLFVICGRLEGKS